MRRHPALVELSRDHHQALAVALRLRRATSADSGDLRAAFLAFWREGGAAHFDVEEAVLLPALEAAAGELPIARRVLAEHETIRGRAAALAAGSAAPAALLAHLGQELTDHVRLEERELFPLLERVLDEDELTRVAQLCRAEEQRLAGGG